MRYGRGWIALAAVALLTPLGLMAIGSAWGEWDTETVEEISGHSPEGMKRAEDSRHKVPLPDYEVPGLGDSALGSGLGTIISAVIGAGVTACAVLLIARTMKDGRVS